MGRTQRDLPRLSPDPRRRSRDRCPVAGRPAAAHDGWHASARARGWPAWRWSWRRWRGPRRSPAATPRNAGVRARAPVEWRLDAERRKGPDTIEVRFDIEHVRPGKRWQLFLSDNGTRIFAGTRTADGDGEIRASRSPRPARHRPVKAYGVTPRAGEVVPGRRRVLRRSRDPCPVVDPTGDPSSLNGVPDAAGPHEEGIEMIETARCGWSPARWRSSVAGTTAASAKDGDVIEARLLQPQQRLEAEALARRRQDRGRVRGRLERERPDLAREAVQERQPHLRRHQDHPGRQRLVHRSEARGEHRGERLLPGAGQEPRGAARPAAGARRSASATSDPAAHGPGETTHRLPGPFVVWVSRRPTATGARGRRACCRGRPVNGRTRCSSGRVRCGAGSRGS